MEEGQQSQDDQFWGFVSVSLVYVQADNKKSVSWQIVRSCSLMLSTAYLSLNTDPELAAGSALTHRPQLFLQSAFHLPFLELGEFWNTVVSFHKMNPNANFCLPVMGFYQSWPFLPFRSYPTTLALCSSYICLLKFPEQQFIPAPGSLHMWSPLLCIWALPCWFLLVQLKGSFLQRGLPWPLFSNSTPHSITPTSHLLLALPCPVAGQKAHYITLTPTMDLSCLLPCPVYFLLPWSTILVLVAQWMQHGLVLQKFS